MPTVVQFDPTIRVYRRQRRTTVTSVPVRPHQQVRNGGSTKPLPGLGVCSAYDKSLKPDYRRLFERALEFNVLLQGCSTEDEVYNVIGSTAAELLCASAGGFYAARRAEEPRVRVVARWGKETGTEPVFEINDCCALRRGAIHHIADPSSDVTCAHLANSAAARYVCIPLIAAREILGILCSVDQPCVDVEREADNLKIASSVAEVIKLAISNVRVRERLRDEAIRDPLTGLFNRRFLEEALCRDLWRADRGNRPLSVAMFDLDGFKHINDRCGHDIGDMLLTRFARLLRDR